MYNVVINHRGRCYFLYARRARDRPPTSTETGPIFCRSHAINAPGSKRIEFPILKQGMRPSAASL